MDDDATLLARTRSVGDNAKVAPTLDLDRYDLGTVLGRGGMGEVRLARDTRIEREVAVKLMRGDQSDGETVARFFREAKVQGALQHPAIVPVHDLGIDRNGVPYFVMKRLAGITLSEMLANKQKEPGGEIDKAWPRRLLLTRFVDVCLAIAFAHDRGVVHRDIKPANIMLGDFGEAYILDWGLAKIADQDAVVGVGTISGDDTHTAVGALLGTPGYLAPEQARGDTVDARADVYALGCVLFEILAGIPALPRGVAAIPETLAADEHRPSAKASDVPPELDDLCARATAQHRRDRPTARELADRVQAYLDGDRDLNARRELAHQHARRARVALGMKGDDARAEAMREAGHALALDANNPLAQSVLSRLLIQGPEVIPEGARKAADDERAHTRMKTMAWAARGYFSLAAALPVVFFFSVREPGLVVLTSVLCAVMGIGALALGKRPLPMRSRWFLAFLGMNSALLVLAGILFGPLFLLPVYLVGSFSCYIVQPTTYRPWIVVAAHVLPIALVVGCELSGLLPRTFHVEGGALVLRARVIDLDSITTTVLIVVALALQIINNTIILLANRRAQEHAQDRLHAQRWHLGQLVPTGAPDLTRERQPLQDLPLSTVEIK